MVTNSLFSRPIAHRGLHDLSVGSPENSASAFRRACEHGYGIECDVQLSRDDVPIVIHDASLERTSVGSGQVRNMTGDEIASIPLKDSGHNDHILRLSDLLAHIDGRVPLFIELKHQDDGRNLQLARSVAKELGKYEGEAALISFDPNLLQQARQSGFKGPMGTIVARFDDDGSKRNLSLWERFALRHILHFPWTRFDFIDCDQKALTLPMVRILRTLGFKTASWTIRSEAEALEALRHCDQITFEGYLPAPTPQNVQDLS